MPALSSTERFREWVSERGGLTATQWGAAMLFLAGKTEADGETFVANIVDVVNGRVRVTHTTERVHPKPGSRITRPSWGHIV